MTKDELDIIKFQAKEASDMFRGASEDDYWMSNMKAATETINKLLTEIDAQAAEIERLKSQLAYIESFMENQQLSVDETYAQIFRFLKGG